MAQATLMLPVPADVPIHRPSVGAMHVTCGTQAEPQPFKPYTYRGTGEDQFPETLTRPEPKPKPVAVTAEEYNRRRAREVAAMKRRAKRRREERWFQERMRERAEYEATRPKPLPIPLPEVGEDDPEPVRFIRSPRPAPGWKPLTVGDIDDLLAEIGDTP